MGVLDWFRSRLRWRLPHPPAVDASGAASTAHSAAPEAPFDTWTSVLLASHDMLVITENGIFVRWAPRHWYLWINGMTVAFGDELPALIKFLEFETRSTYIEELRGLPEC